MVYVDTTGIAYAMLYTLRATGQIDDYQFREALRILSRLYENRISANPNRIPETLQASPNPMGIPAT